MFPPCPRKVLDIYFPAQTGLCEYPLTFSGHTSQAAYNKIITEDNQPAGISPGIHKMDVP